MSRFFLDGQMVTGGIIITVAAVFAMGFLLLTLFHILLALIVPAYAHRFSSPQERNFITSPLGLYIICLFASNFITSIGGVIEAQWVMAKAITEGPACSTQAFTFQLGGNASALWTAVISISALRTFMFRARSLPKVFTLPLILVLWIAMIVFDGLASTIFADHSGSFFYGIAGMWCWITPNHSTARLATQYIWMWVLSFVSAVCFFLVFLSVRGNIRVRRDAGGRNVRFNKRAFDSYALGSGEEQFGVLVGTVGKTMCWFPISYITLTLPISVSRVAETYGFPVPVYAFIFSAVSHLLLGIATPILYFAIRHSLKHVSNRISSDTTLNGSFGEKLGGESFHTPQEKRPSPVSKFDPYPWTPTPSTQEWAPPSPHHGVGERTSRGSSFVSYAMAGDGHERLSAYSENNAPLVPPSLRIGHMGSSLHRPMTSISTITSTSTVVGPHKHLSPVSEGESPTDSMLQPQITLPPAALVSDRQSLPNPYAIQPSDLERLADVPLSPKEKSGHQRSETETSVYTGPRAISPDLNALLQASKTTTSPAGPPPPPRKTRRLPIPSVPVDVDESDQGSICSARPSAETFDAADTRPMSIGDMTERSPAKRADSMRTFWAAYDGGSPRSPEMPHTADAVLRRDTMRTFWAAYEEPSPTSANMPMPLDPFASMYGNVVEANVTSPESLMFRSPSASVNLKPSISAVGRPAYMNTPPKVTSRFKGDHRRSRSFTPTPTPPVAVLHPKSSKPQPALSATARLNNFQGRKTPTPTPSEGNQSSDGNYRPPRPQPGYV